MNELNYCFHDHKAKRESYTALQSVELKFTSENGNCNKCSKFQLLSTHVYLTFLAFQYFIMYFLALIYLKIRDEQQHFLRDM